MIVFVAAYKSLVVLARADPYHGPAGREKQEKDGSPRHQRQSKESCLKMFVCGSSPDD